MVKVGAGRGGYGDRFIDLRVEDHSDPVNEVKTSIEASSRLLPNRRGRSKVYGRRA